MTQSITYSSEMGVELIQHTGSDYMIASAARVSTGSEAHFGPDATAQVDSKRTQGLISYLMKSRHGSPFEHGMLTFRVEAPIFVFRELMRHRIASYNETSARYREMEPKFYIFPKYRPLVQEGSSAHPKLVDGDKWMLDDTNSYLREACVEAWAIYQKLIYRGVALEVARSVLPVNLYSSAYVSMNPRALMNFISLRVDSPDAAYSTKPQYEIEQMALKMADEFYKRFPITYTEFVNHGRVAP